MTTHHSLKRIALFLGILTLLPALVWAKRVFLNGVDITGMSNRTFQNVTVRLDGNGNIIITGKQYKVVRRANGQTPPTYRPTNRTAPSVPSAPTGANLNKNYLMIIQRTSVNASGYRLDININGKQVRNFKLGEVQAVLPLNRYLRRGRNVVTISAYKTPNRIPGGVSVLISTGKVKDGKVMINQPYILQYNRTSNDAKSYRHIFPIRIK